MAPLPPPSHLLGASLVLGVSTTAALLLSACQPKASQELQQRQVQMELKLQQLEQRLNAVSPRDGADRAGKPPAGPVKSLTYRTSDQGNRLRIYWADGSSSDLECTQEQSTLACG